MTAFAHPASEPGASRPPLASQHPAQGTGGQGALHYTSISPRSAWVLDMKSPLLLPDSPRGDDLPGTCFVPLPPHQIRWPGRSYFYKHGNYEQSIWRLRT